MLLVALCVTPGCAQLDLRTPGPSEVTNAEGPDLQVAADLTARAGVAFSKGRVRKAERLLREALVAAPRYGPAHNNLGRLLYDRGDYHRAAWEFDRATEAMPDRPEPLINLAMLLEDVSLYDEATGYYRDALDLAPHDPVAVGGLARTLLARDSEPEDIELLLRDLLLVAPNERWRRWAENELALRRWESAGDEPEAESDAPWRTVEPTPAEPLPAPSELLPMLVNPAGA